MHRDYRSIYASRLYINICIETIDQHKSQYSTVQYSTYSEQINAVHNAYFNISKQLLLTYHDDNDGGGGGAC